MSSLVSRRRQFSAGFVPLEGSSDERILSIDVEATTHYEEEQADASRPLHECLPQYLDETIFELDSNCSEPWHFKYMQEMKLLLKKSGVCLERHFDNNLYLTTIDLPKDAYGKRTEKLTVRVTASDLSIYDEETMRQVVTDITDAILTTVPEHEAKLVERITRRAPDHQLDSDTMVEGIEEPMDIDSSENEEGNEGTIAYMAFDAEECEYEMQFRTQLCQIMNLKYSGNAVGLYFSQNLINLAMVDRVKTLRPGMVIDIKPSLVCKTENCGYECTNRVYMANHLDHKHSIPSAYASPHQHFCDKCNRVYAHRHALNKHAKVCTGLVLPFECSACKGRFEDKFAFNVHPSRCIVLMNRSYQESTAYADKAGVGDDSGVEQQSGAPGSKPWKCTGYEGCNKAFVLKSGLTRHLDLHEMAYVCWCGDTFTGKKDLKRHMGCVHSATSQRAKNEAWAAGTECYQKMEGGAIGAAAQKRKRSDTEETPAPRKRARKTKTANKTKTASKTKTTSKNKTVIKNVHESGDKVVFEEEAEEEVLNLDDDARQIHLAKAKEVVMEGAWGPTQMTVAEASHIAHSQDAHTSPDPTMPINITLIKEPITRAAAKKANLTILNPTNNGSALSKSNILTSARGNETLLSSRPRRAGVKY